MGLSRAAVRTVLGIVLAVALGACGSADPIQPVSVRPVGPPVELTTTTMPDVAASALPGESGGAIIGGGGGPNIVRAKPGGPAVTGRIEIPKIGLDHVTYEGNTLAQIDHGPSHWPGTPMPGHPGNSVFPGHRITHTHPFFFIDELVPGDQIIFTTAEGRFVYEVYQSLVVRPSETWIVDNTPEPIVTIFGCHPRGSARFRYVVRGRLVSPGAPAAVARPRPQPAPVPAAPHPAPAPPSRPPATTTTTAKPSCIICLH